MIQKPEGGRWKEADFPNALQKRYAVSNRGRLISFTHHIFKDGTLLKGGLQQGYRIMCYRLQIKKTLRYEFVFFHKLVAEYFCKQKTPLHNKVIFKDYNRKNLYAENLQWATAEEQYRHSTASKKYIQSLKLRRTPTIGSVLGAGDVRKIKLALLNGKTLKELALQYGVSDMQIYRIKTGENRGHVKV